MASFLIAYLAQGPRGHLRIGGAAVLGASIALLGFSVAMLLWTPSTPAKEGVYLTTTWVWNSVGALGVVSALLALAALYISNQGSIRRVLLGAAAVLCLGVGAAWLETLMAPMVSIATFVGFWLLAIRNAALWRAENSG